jgi:hypothetical protein
LSAPDHQRLSNASQTLHGISSNVRLSVFSGDRRYLEASERLRLTQRLPDVPGLDHALTPELDPELPSAAGAC